METRTWTIEPLAPDHIPGAARLHVRCFQGYFLAGLGERFLRYMYRDNVESDRALGYVALDDSGEVVGAVIGVLDYRDYRRRFFRRRTVRKAVAVVPRLFCSARLWGQIARRLVPQVRRCLRAVFGQRNRSTDRSADTPTASLLSIAVVPGMRGSGVAAELVRRFERGAAERGRCRVGLSVRAENRRAIRFYQKAGYVMDERGKDTLHFVKELQ